MATLSQYKKKLKDAGFVDKICSLGFTLAGNGFWFFRKRGEFIDTLMIQRIASGNGCRVHVCTYIPEIVQDYNFDDFPKKFDSIVGNICGMYLSPDGVVRVGRDWNTETDDELLDSYSKIVAAIEGDLITWFDSVNSREKLYEALLPSVRDDEETGQIFKLLLQ